MEGKQELVCDLSNCAIFNDLEWTLTLFSRSHYSLTLNVLQTATNRAIVTIQGKYETALKLLNGTSFNDLEWPLSHISRSRYYLTSKARKWYKIELYLQCPTNRKSHMVYRTAPFSMTLKDSKHRFQCQAILWHWISSKWLQIRP